jgi:hypothetical protein
MPHITVSFLTLLGIAAAILVLVAYYNLESGRFDAHDPRYYWMNAISSTCLIITIASTFDAADAGAVFMEACWLAISLKGLWRHSKQPAKHTKHENKNA